MGVPVTNIEQYWFYLTHFCPKSKMSNIQCKKFPIDMAIWLINAQVANNLRSQNVNLNSMLFLASNMSPMTKASGDFEITLPITALSLLAKSSAISLSEPSNKLVGLKSFPALLPHSSRSLSNPLWSSFSTA